MSKLTFVCSVNGTNVSSSVASTEKRTAAIDAAAMRSVYDAARAHAGSAHDAPVQCTRVDRARADEDMSWVHRRMTPDCAAVAWNPSQVVSYDRWSCRYMGKGVVTDKDGNRQLVYNPFKQWSGRIASCAAPDPDKGLGIPDSTMKAVQKMAWYQADGEAAELDENQFMCRIESLPVL